MPKPADYHIDAALTSFACELGVGGAFASDKIYPVANVKKESGKYWIYPSPELRDDVPLIRAAGDVAFDIDWKPTTATYTCEEYAVRRFLPNRTIENSDNPQKLENNTVRKLVHKLRLATEKRIKDVVMSTSYITNYSSPSVKWDASSGTIIIEGNIDTAKEAVVVACGHEPNTIVIPPSVARVVKKNSTIRDMVKYTQSNLLINGDLPSVLFNLNVVIPGAIENTANPAASDSISRIWSTDNVLVAYVDPGATDTETYTLGKQFRAPLNLADGSDQGDRYVVYRYYDKDRHGWWIEVAVLNDEKLVSATCGYLLSDVLT